MIKNTPLHIKRTLNYFLQLFNGSHTQSANEYTLVFNSSLGNGKIILNALNWGVYVFRLDIFTNCSLAFNECSLEHDALELLFISNGTIDYTRDNLAPMHLESYSNILSSTKSGLKRSLQFQANKNVSFTYTYIPCKDFFISENLMGNAQNYKEFYDLLNTADRASFMHVGPYSLKIENQIKKLNKTWNNPAITRLYFEGQFYLLLALQLSEYKDSMAKNHPFSRSEIKKVQHAVDFINTHISSPLSIPLLCQHVGLTQTKLQAGFQSVFSKTVNEYMRHVRLENAHTLIATTDLSISEIVYRVGLNSKSYFSKIFKEHYGVLPTEFRAYRKTTSTLK
ncbi:helix-turn-helix transcriptional regulator [Aquimarina intermedia]|nr:AraC family transcriptional regulator [Aquimarina intermedia]